MFQCSALKHLITKFPSDYLHVSHRYVWGSGSIASRMLNLGSTQMRVASLTPRQLYPKGKSPFTQWK
jgi:hypothetical protein